VRLDPGLELLSERLARLDAPCVLATVVSAAGSTYRKPGARMLIEADGRILGLLTGGCLENDLREHAAKVLSSGVARTVTYDMRTDNDLIFGIGAGCEGSMEILLEPVSGEGRAARALITAAELSRRDEPISLVTIYDGAADQLGTHLRRDGSTDAVPGALIQPVAPLPAVLICGAGPDVQPLSAAILALHYPLVIADHRAAYANADNFPGAALSLGPPGTLAARLDLSQFFAAVAMSHHLASDVEYLRAFAATEIEYIGVLGPRMRRERLLAELGDFAAAMRERLRGPIGLDIGAVTPEGIALAITAEIHAVASRRSEINRLDSR
jgi:xanthine/CO dehydrogenase XdhC/CoxF family maturation factor